jgi:acyl carrier protein
MILQMQTIDQKIICSELCQFISANILAPGVELQEDTILTNLGIDSFSVIEIILFIERKFGVVIPDEYLVPENLKSVSAMAACTIRQVLAGRE